MKTIGLTGGIGSGKSTVARVLEELGALVIHADLVGHEVYRPGTDGWRQVVDAFGPGVVAADGTIDRATLGPIVFGSPEALARLNGIVHPLIAAEVRRRIEAARAAGRTAPVVVEAAILIEANWLPLVDEVWLVVAGRDAVIDRVHRDRGMAPADVARRIDAQLTDAARRAYADVVIENVGTRDALAAAVRDVWHTRCAG